MAGMLVCRHGGFRKESAMRKILFVSAVSAVMVLGASFGLAQGTSQNNGRTSRGITGRAAGNPNNSAAPESSRAGAAAGDSSTGSANDATTATTDPNASTNPNAAGTGTAGAANDSANSAYTRTGEEPREGHNWGWIGILGLAGLAGLAKRRGSEHTHTHRVETRGAASTLTGD